MRKRITGLLAIGALVVSACSGSAATPTPAPTPVPTAAPVVTAPPSAAVSAAPAGPDLTTTKYKAEAVGKFGGKLVLGDYQEPVTAWYGQFDTSATDVEAFGPALWGLWNATSDYKWYGQLATNVPTVGNGGVKLIDGGGMDVTINLVQGANWSDGKPITCDDLAYQVTWQMDPGQVGNVQGHLGWENITKVDGGTGTNCVAHFNKVYEAYLGLWTPLLPKHYLSTVSAADSSSKLYTQKDLASGVYSGPYMPTKWAAGAEIDYIPNPQFWTTIKKAKAPFDQVVFTYYADNTAGAASFKNGQIDVAMDFNHNDLAALKTSGIPAANIASILELRQSGQ